MNPGNEIALLMLYTPNIRNYAIQAEKNYHYYANNHNYTLYIER